LILKLFRPPNRKEEATTISRPHKEPPCPQN
jgi:hypothetical protein